MIQNSLTNTCLFISFVVSGIFCVILLDLLLILFYFSFTGCDDWTGELYFNKREQAKMMCVHLDQLKSLKSNQMDRL